MSAPEPEFTELNTRRLGPARRYFLRHPVAMDILIAAVFAAPAVASTVFGTGGERPPRLLLAAVGAAVLMWRRRYPVWVAGAIGALAVVSLATMRDVAEFDLAVGLVVYAVAAARPARTAWLTFGALSLAVGGAISLWLHPAPGRAPWVVTVGSHPEDSDQVLYNARAVSVMSLVIFSLAAIAIGISVRNRRLHLAALVDRANRLAIERDQQVQLAAATERARIAREMHDVVAHSLSVMIALADGAGAALDRSPDRAREAVTELSATGRTALADMRRVLAVLRDPAAPLDPQPGAHDLTELIAGLRNAGLPVRATFTGPPLPPDPGLQLAVFRIIQESLTNVLRHARGTSQVDLVVSCSNSRVEIIVTDGGMRTPAATVRDAGGGKGLIGMRERAAVYGGVVEAGPHNSGWRTHATLMWDEENR